MEATSTSRLPLPWPFRYPWHTQPRLFSYVLGFGHNVRSILLNLSTSGPLQVTVERHCSHKFSSAFTLYVTTSDPLSSAGKAPCTAISHMHLSFPKQSVLERGPVSYLLSYLFNSPKTQIPSIRMNKEILKILKILAQR